MNYDTATAIKNMQELRLDAERVRDLLEDLIGSLDTLEEEYSKYDEEEEFEFESELEDCSNAMAEMLDEAERQYKRLARMQKGEITRTADKQNDETAKSQDESAAS
jgi:hypothetical protein